GALVLDPLPLPRQGPAVGHRRRRRGPAFVEEVALQPARRGLLPQVVQDPPGPRGLGRVLLALQGVGGPAIAGLEPLQVAAGLPPPAREGPARRGPAARPAGRRAVPPPPTPPAAPAPRPPPR